MTTPLDADALRAQLSQQLMGLCHKVPQSLANGSINITRNWLDAQKKAMTVLKKKTSSISEIESAINSMRRFK